MISFITGNKPKPFLDSNEELKTVLIPLTSDRLLVGEYDTHLERTNQTILRILASTSYKSFIARSDEPHFRKLTTRIGKNAIIWSSAEINAIKRDALAGLIK